MKLINRIISIVGVLVLLVVIALLTGQSSFVSKNEVLSAKNGEVQRPEVIVSCQSDCTMNDGRFHPECVGFNGCKNSSFLKNRVYCEEDSDCVVDTGCCNKVCNGSECDALDFCDVSNKQYVDAHKISCGTNIICSQRLTCKPFEEAVCRNNQCRIIG